MTICITATRRSLEKPWKVFQNENDELAGVRPIRGRIPLPPCILVRVSSRAPSSEYEMSWGAFPNFLFVVRAAADGDENAEYDTRKYGTIQGSENTGDNSIPTLRGDGGEGCRCADA